MILKIDVENKIIYLEGPVSLNELIEQLDMIEYDDEDWVIAPDMVINFSQS